jgi:stage II sporulation protein D
MKYIRLIVALLLVFMLVSCNKGKVEESPEPAITPEDKPKVTETTEPTEAPKFENLPENITDGGESVLNVYNAKAKKIEQITLNEYLYGVVAGEMKNDWPEEALRAQAILARTFLLEFLTNKESNFENADISTDVKEAQAYNKESINDIVKEAVESTDGMIVTSNNEPIIAWFHSCSGGITATATEGLGHKEDVPYIKSVESDESEAPEDVRAWTNTFTKDKLMAALADMEEDIGDFKTIEMGKKGPSGRCITLKFGDAEIPCVNLRLALSASEFRSTLLDELTYENDKLKVSGKGFGHGVGMSQWGAKKMADDGKKAEEIINHYFNEVQIVSAWDKP